MHFSTFTHIYEKETMRKSIQLLVTIGLFATTQIQAQSKTTFTVNTEEDWNNLEKTVPTDGWVLINYDTYQYLLNYSNKDYILYLRLKCKNSSNNPSFLVEYSNNYRDGDYGGIDFISSEDDSNNVIQFLVDGIDFKNPFKEKAKLKGFADALKKGTKLTIKVFDTEMNVETGKDALKLNRAIDFKLKNADLLDTSVSCD